MVEIVCALSLVGCSSVLGGADGKEGSERGGDGDGDAPGPPGEGAVDVVQVGDVECLSTSAASTPIRLMTREQFGGLVHQVFPGVTLDDGALENLPQTLNNVGYANNGCASVDASHQERLLEITESVAEGVIAQLDQFVECQPSAECAEEFARTYGRRSYRRTLSDEQREELVGLYEQGSDAETGMRLLVQGLLLAPDALYQFEVGTQQEDGTRRLTGFELASKLSYVFWGSAPDDELLDAAEAGELDTVEGLAVRARQMLSDERASGILRFFTQWLHFSHLGDKDADIFPEFTEETAAAAVEESKRFIEYVLEGDGRFESLVLDRTAFVTPALASIYGLSSDAPVNEAPPEPVDPTGECNTTGGCKQAYSDATDCNNGMGGICMCGVERCIDLHPPAPTVELGNETWEQVQLNSDERAGLFTRLAFLSATGGTAETSHVTRGVDMLANILCVEIPEPSAETQDSFPLIPDDPELTPQDVIEIHQADPTCASCHVYIDGVGLGFEHYNSIGEYRSVYEVNGKPVDASGDIFTNDPDSGIEGPFEGALEFSERVATADIAQRCFTDNFYRFALMQQPGGDSCSYDIAHAAFAEGEFNMTDLMVGLVMSPDFRFRGGHD